MVHAPTLPEEVRDHAIEAVQRRVDHEIDGEVFQRDADFVERRTGDLGRAAERYFAAEVRGLDRLPAEGPFLIVGNHSGGWWMPDVWALGTELVAHFGPQRPLYGLVFDAAFVVPGFGPLLRRLGAVPASMANAERALDLGAGVLAYPGGDWEAYRPWTQRHRIDLHGHSGFVRLALRRGIPVYPAVSHGSHDSMVVLSRGDRLARMVGLDRLRGSVCPVVLGGPLGVTLFAPYVPMPTKLIVEVLEPLDWSAYGPDDADDPELVPELAEDVRAEMQRALDRLVREVPHPLWERVRTAIGRT